MQSLPEPNPHQRTEWGKLKVYLSNRLNLDEVGTIIRLVGAPRDIINNSNFVRVIEWMEDQHIVSWCSVQRINELLMDPSVKRTDLCLTLVDPYRWNVLGEENLLDKTLFAMIPRENQTEIRNSIIGYHYDVDVKLAVLGDAFRIGYNSWYKNHDDHLLHLRPEKRRDEFWQYVIERAAPTIAEMRKFIDTAYPYHSIQKHSSYIKYLTSDAWLPRPRPRPSPLPSPPSSATPSLSPITSAAPLPAPSADPMDVVQYPPRFKLATMPKDDGKMDPIEWLRHAAHNDSLIHKNSTVMEMFIDSKTARLCEFDLLRNVYTLTSEQPGTPLSVILRKNPWLRHTVRAALLLCDDGKPVSTDLFDTCGSDAIGMLITNATIVGIQGATLCGLLGVKSIGDIEATIERLPPPAMKEFVSLLIKKGRCTDREVEEFGAFATRMWLAECNSGDASASLEGTSATYSDKQALLNFFGKAELDPSSPIVKERISFPPFSRELIDSLRTKRSAVTQGIRFSSLGSLLASSTTSSTPVRETWHDHVSNFLKKHVASELAEAIVSNVVTNKVRLCRLAAYLTDERLVQFGVVEWGSRDDIITALRCVIEQCDSKETQATVIVGPSRETASSHAPAQ